MGASSGAADAAHRGGSRDASEGAREVSEGVDVLARDPRMAAMVRSLARLGRIVEQTGQHAGVSLAQYRLLLFVAREPQRAGELATRAAVSKPTLTNLVNTLEREGLITKERLADDRRGIRLEVTEAGSAALAAAEHILIGRIGQLLDDVEDVERILSAFADLDAALDREVARFLERTEAERADG